MERVRIKLRNNDMHKALFINLQMAKITPLEKGLNEAHEKLVDLERELATITGKYERQHDELENTKSDLNTLIEEHDALKGEVCRTF